MMGTEIFKIDASWAEKLTKTRVQFLLTPTVCAVYTIAGSSSTKEVTMSATLQLGTLAVVAVASLCSPARASYSYDG